MFSARIKKRNKTPWQLATSLIFKCSWLSITQQEAIFGLLCWVGVPRAMAYKVIFPESKATPASIAQLSCRLANDIRLGELFSLLERNSEILHSTLPKSVERRLKGL